MISPFWLRTIIIEIILKVECGRGSGSNDAFLLKYWYLGTFGDNKIVKMFDGFRLQCQAISSGESCGVVDVRERQLQLLEALMIAFEEACACGT